MSKKVTPSVSQENSIYERGRSIGELATLYTPNELKTFVKGVVKGFTDPRSPNKDDDIESIIQRVIKHCNT